jgi:hypothetical protein
MGTSGAYGGSGGADGRAIRDAVADAISSAGGGADKPVRTDLGDQPPDQDASDQGTSAPSRVDPNSAAHAANLFSRSPGSSRTGSGGARRRTAASGGSGGSRSSGGPQRSAARAAAVAGRAAAGAIAYRAGDQATLERLGLDFNELRQLGDPFEVIRRIVEMACGAPESTIQDDEQRMVAAGVAEWIVVAEGDGGTPSPQEVARQTVGVIIAEVLLSESGEMLSAQVGAGISEQDIRDASDAAAARIEFSDSGTSEVELAAAIEAGLETLREIIGGDS